MALCNKCKKERPRFDHARRICNGCYKKQQNRYFYVRTGVRKPSKGKDRRENIKKNGGFYTHKEWMRLKERFNHRCLRCGRREPEVRLQADHIVPVCRGGTSWIENIQSLCARCNQEKGRKIIDYRGVHHFD